MGVAFVVESPEQWTKLLQLEERIATMDAPPTEQAEADSKKARVHAHAALWHLQQAQEELQKAMRDEGQHAEALRLAENAISKLRKVMEIEKRPLETSDSSSRGNGMVLRDELFDQWLATGL